ncbi:MAG: phytoene dehydrogenase [Flavobacterium sp. MedPE-SWcel]|uniref:phytoene desaturase family protein n=1 Tax=uncultured Flavobacterium sp. TaxID=165435 RepID=UPI00091B4BC5|nr:phytoene desaturase family protein [uncultured Flavobacterium sp.]OIQ21094.1 MAG: phytoene dehydrogenase [Flavobacterium sp. MedPE-SWcel]
MLSISIIGSGFSSLSAACYLANAGYKVSVFEKNDYLGGRARQLKINGFTFDMGPTFYWMPDVFESFFNDFNKKTSDYYLLNKLNPAYKVYFEDQSQITIGDNKKSILETFERIEKGSAKKLDSFLKNAESNYNLAIKDLVYQPGESLFEIINTKTALKLNLFIKTIRTDVKKVVKHPHLRKILEFPVLFLGAKPSNTPSFYNFMNYADFVLGTWHPKGGMYSVVEGMVTLAKSLGVSFFTSSNVSEIKTKNNTVSGIIVNDKLIKSDIVLSGADYTHTEKLLPKKYRQYSDSYWENKTFAPSALLFYIGFDTKIPNVTHHSLFFDADFELHANEIYDNKKWPSNPLFYASFPSITDNTVAPDGKEAGIFLMPLATGLNDTPETREKYYKIIIERLSKQIGYNIKEHILFKESFCVNDFIEDYNSFGGNAYGLANTLFQTHILRPKLKSKKVKNLFFTGQLTVPGPGVPPAIISGKIVSELIQKSLKS